MITLIFLSKKQAWDGRRAVRLGGERDERAGSAGAVEGWLGGAVLRPSRAGRGLGKEVGWGSVLSALAVKRRGR